MANTINDLYLKYVNKVGRTLENDRYFQYLFEMVQAGSNTLQQTHQILHKVVDEKWLTTIEESLDSINEIIEKPRRFIATTEEVVPVALAKKITADSVRHLSMNTQFIASDENGDIQPTRVLNVSTEESYDLYENRFIYHLIQRLVTFIDKRTDVIFWSTGDETSNTLKMESKVDDAYEEIEYKIEMKIKNRQSFAENDSDNMQVFMRIDRVRRMVLAMRQSSFCSLMAGCSKVRSPIQRTNLMMKDPNYRTCYKLWQFLESYDEVGYTIDVKDSSLEFDEEYMIQLYTNLITNYTVFKSLLESDPRKLEEAAAKRRKVIKPKFIKKIEEQIVDDYDIPDVEVRKVIIEEVTQAQLDAEAKLEEETSLRKAAEEAKEEAELQLENERWQSQSQMMMYQQMAQEQLEEAQKAAEEQVEEARKQAEEQVQEARRDAENQVQEVRQLAEEQILRTQRELEERIQEAQRQMEDQIQEARRVAEEQMQKAREEAEVRVQEIQKAAEKQVQEAQKEVEAAAQAEQSAVELAAAEKEARKRAEENAANAREAQTKAEKNAEKDRELCQKTQLKAQADQQARKAAEAQAAEEVQARKDAELARQIEAQAREAAERAKEQAEQEKMEAEQAAQAAEREAEEARRGEQEALKRAEKEAKAREKAEAKLDANRLTNRIIAALTERRLGKENAVTIENPDEEDDANNDNEN
ncbi:MAG: DUF2357 domain-containing protein [Eubacterium sp.]|nr:DUF2357 domain-containing protein [Eubacterium sp.]